MTKHCLIAVFLLTALVAAGQGPDDALRQSFQVRQGTARNMAVGGAAGSLGGDITAAYVNPAGLGFYRTGEFVLSGGWNLIGTNYDYRGSGLKDNKNAFTYGPIGFVYGRTNAYNPRKSTAFSISVNQTANFNNVVHYRGLNNATSWSEQYLEELARNRADTNSALNDFRFGSSLAYRTFLVDTVTFNGQFGYQSAVNVATGVNQENDIITRGGVHEINLALASNSSDKFYIGGSIGIPIYSYTRRQTYSEADATNNPNNGFNSFRYTEDYTSKGVGVNLKLGAIYRPVEKLRLGLSLHSPTFANMTDQIRTSINTITEVNNQSYNFTATSDQLNNGLPGQYRYTMTTPWQGIFSGTYIFNEVSDIRRQKGFITADVEYMRHQGTQYAILADGTQDDDAYYKSVNQAIDARYKGAFNFRLGGEVKFTDWMVRAGAARYGNPYQASDLKAGRTLLSTGLGYRNKGIFVDLTYVYTRTDETNVPYYLADVSNTFATGRNNKSNIMMTVGFKF